MSQLEVGHQKRVLGCPVPANKDLRQLYSKVRLGLKSSRNAVIDVSSGYKSYKPFVFNHDAYPGSLRGCWMCSYGRCTVVKLHHRSSLGPLLIPPLHKYKRQETACLYQVIECKRLVLKNTQSTDDFRRATFYVQMH